jgi:hypothetical protein
VKVKRLFKTISDDLAKASPSPEFIANVAELKNLMRTRNNHPYFSRGLELLEKLDQHQFSVLQQTLRTHLSSETLSPPTANVKDFLRLFDKYEKMMIRERPRCFPEAKALREELRTRGFAKKPTVKKTQFIHHPTIEDNENPKVALVFVGAFESNRRRH